MDAQPPVPVSNVPTTRDKISSAVNTVNRVSYETPLPASTSDSAIGFGIPEIYGKMVDDLVPCGHDEDPAVIVGIGKG